jgi:hypothetical protein
MFKQYFGIGLTFNAPGTSSAALRTPPKQRNWKNGNSRHDKERNDFQGKERVLLLVYKYDSCFHVQSQVLFMDLTRLGLLFKHWLIKKFQECIYGEIPKWHPN